MKPKLKLKHYYHMYADGQWQTPFQEHLLALEESTLLDNLDFIGVGIVGSEQNRNTLKKALPSNFQVIAEANTGWEQVTQTPLSQDLDEPSKILYAHTKGAANWRPGQDGWRQEMTEATVCCWRECVSLLDEYDTVGTKWRKEPWRHYSGTFWWATSRYLSTLPPLSQAQRFDAECWIGLGRDGGHYVDINPSYPDLGIKVYGMGRVFVGYKSASGYCYSDLEIEEIGDPIFGDEFIGFLPDKANRILVYLMSKGAKCSFKGETITVEEVRLTSGNKS